MQTKRPLVLFVAASLAFLVGEAAIGLIKHHYTGVHFYFGLCAPLLLGYFPYTLFKWRGIGWLPLNPAWPGPWHWSIVPAAVCTAAMSFVNEVIDDPKANGVPFHDAWHHMAADMAGLSLFLLAYCLGLHHLVKGPNNSSKPSGLHSPAQLKR